MSVELNKPKIELISRLVFLLSLDGLWRFPTSSDLMMALTAARAGVDNCVCVYKMTIKHHVPIFQLPTTSIYLFIARFTEFKFSIRVNCYYYYVQGIIQPNHRPAVVVMRHSSSLSFVFSSRSNGWRGEEIKVNQHFTFVAHGERDQIGIKMHFCFLRNNESHPSNLSLPPSPLTHHKAQVQGVHFV